MQTDPIEPMIEQYRRELMEFSRKYPKYTQETEAAPETSEAVEDAERILPAGRLVRDDLPQEDALETVAQVRRQSTVLDPGQPASPEPSNDIEQDFVQDGDEFPPYLDGEIEQFPDEEAFMRQNPESGFLRVQVFAANQAFPIQNASVVVSKVFGGNIRVFFTAQTDANGIMSRITLPAPDRELADSPSALQPYSTYNIVVTHPRFTEVRIDDVAVFDSVETVQNVEMIPCMPDEEG